MLAWASLGQEIAHICLSHQFHGNQSIYSSQRAEQSISTRNRTFLVKICVAYIRPTLEYTSINATWNPIIIELKCDIKNVQASVYKKATRSPSYDIYDYCPLYMRIDSLKTRCIRSNLLKVCSCLMVSFKFTEITLTLLSPNCLRGARM